MENGNATEYIKVMQQQIKENPDLQIVSGILPDDGKARYDAIKKFCCQEAGGLHVLYYEITGISREYFCYRS